MLQNRTVRTFSIDDIVMDTPMELISGHTDNFSYIVENPDQSFWTKRQPWRMTNGLELNPTRNAIYIKVDDGRRPKSTAPLIPKNTTACLRQAYPIRT